MSEGERYILTRRWLSLLGDLFISIIILTPLLILISLGYRLLIFLKHGYNPKVTIDTFFPQSSSEYSWKGIEIIYDFMVTIPVEFSILIFWVVFTIVSNWVIGYINDFEVKHM